MANSVNKQEWQVQAPSDSDPYYRAVTMSGEDTEKFGMCYRRHAQLMVDRHNAFLATQRAVIQQAIARGNQS